MEQIDNVDKKIELTPELAEIFNNIKRDSNYSSRELLEVYSSDPEVIKMAMKIRENTIMLENQVKEFRTLHPELDDNSFFQTVLYNHSKNIIESIKKDYGQAITPELVQRLDRFNVEVIKISGPKSHGDISAEHELSKIIINLDRFALDRPDIEGKAVRAMLTMPHEIFHFIHTILKDKDKCDERMVYELTNGEKVGSLGMTGHMLNEGYVEKMSKEFCERNNIPYSVNPSYIQFTKLCDYISKTDPKVNKEFLVNNNYEGILNEFSEEAKEEYKATERYEYINNFKLRTSSGERRIIKQEEVVRSYNEMVELDLTVDKENKQGFDQRSEEEIKIANQIKTKNQEIKTKKEEQKAIEKPKVLKLNNEQTNRGGFVNILVLLLIVGGAIIIAFLIAYFLINRG